MRRIFTFCVLIAAYVTTEVSSLEEGSFCTNFDGSAGVCKVDRTCQWALDKIKAKEIKASQLVRCGLKGSMSIICCRDDSVHPIELHHTAQKQGEGGFTFPDEESGPSVKPPPPPPVPSMEPVLLKKRKSEVACELIQKLRPGGLDFHIINGEGADPGEFPHMTAIGYSAELDETKYTFDCGGSLISINFVLTAGHCVNKRNQEPKVVRFGRVSLQDYKDDDNDPNEAQLIHVKKIILHPKYTSRKKYNDIALLEMAANVQYEKIVKPACLYTKSDSSSRTADLTIAGWGILNTETKERSQWLQKGVIKELPLEECREVYKRLGYGSALSENIVQSQLCATARKADGKIIDACQGDSGGPIQFKMEYENEDFFYLVGLTSFGAACGSEIPGVYTRVSEFLDWIEPIVWPGKVEI